MANFDKEETVRRVQEKMNAGDFFFPEDLAVAVAEHLGVKVEGTPFAQDEEGSSRTAGNTPPASGETVASVKARGATPTSAVGGSDETDSGAYSDLSKEELQDELASRDLAVSGNKDELIARLEADDEGGE